jgi:ribosomal subunit interface protein
MTNLISFRNLESPDQLREFVDGYLEQKIGRFDDHQEIIANVIVEKKSVKHNSHGHPDFACEIVLHHPSTKNSIVAHKTSSNFYQSVKDTCRAIEHSLIKLTQTRSRRNKKNYDRINRLQKLRNLETGSDS